MVALAASAPAAGAQSNSTQPAAPICGAGQTPQIDTEVVTVVINPGTAWNRRKYTDADRGRILFYADAIRQRFVQPASLGVTPTLAEPLYEAWGGELSRHSAVGGKLVLVVKSNGRLREAFWQVLPLSAPFARALYAAAITADTARDFDNIPGGSGSHMDDTLVVQTRTVASDLPANALPLMRAQLTSYAMETQATTIKKGGLYYPINASDAGVENEGEMQVIVGSDGKAVMPWSQITRLDWRDFVSTMRRAVAESQFAPARSGGCAVPSVMIHSFKFSAQRP
jgi:hypothetical protein